MAKEQAEGDTEFAKEAKRGVTEAVSEVANDRRFLKGRVPQGQDWLNGWAGSSEQVAFHKQERLQTKKEQLRLDNLRRIRRKQVRVMAETRREDIRNWLDQAQFISLSMDERQYRQIMILRINFILNH